MLAARKTALKQILHGASLILAVAFFITTPDISHADDSATTGDMPAPNTQDAPAQETQVEKIPSVIASKNHGKVARAIFTSQIIDREPADDLTEMSNTSDRIYFFTDLRNLAGQIVTHQWEYKNEIMAEIKFRVGDGSRWRVYSSKNLLPEWVGVWTVIVTDENEQILDTSVFNYTQTTMKAKSATPEQQPSE